MRFPFFKFLLILVFAVPSLAQVPNLKLPSDPELAAEARRRFAFSVDEVSVKRWRNAASAINWLLINAPDLYDGLYVNSYKTYEELYKIEKEPTLKQVYLDSMFLSYKLKDELFTLTDREINNLAYRYYKYYKSDKSKYPEIKAAFDRVYEKPETVINNNLVAYMDVYRRIFLGPKTVSENDVLDAYTKIGLIIDQKLAAGGDRDKLQRNRQVVDQMLTSAVKVDCDFISSKLYPELQSNPEDINMAKKILQLGLSGKCLSEEFFLVAAVAVNAVEPTAPLTNLIARSYASSKEYGLSEKYFLELISLQEQDTLKARGYLDLAKTYAAGNQKVKSRDALENAMKLDESLSSEAYSLLGNLYMNSFDDCKQMLSQVADRAVFMLAYDMYQLAGDQKGMKAAKEQFPTMGQAFEQNIKEGDQVSIGCWINKTTTVKVRKER